MFPANEPDGNRNLWIKHWPQHWIVLSISVSAIVRIFHTPIYFCYERTSTRHFPPTRPSSADLACRKRDKVIAEGSEEFKVKPWFKRCPHYNTNKLLRKLTTSHRKPATLPKSGMFKERNVNSTFRARWLASSEVISQVLITSEQPKKNKMAFVGMLSQIKFLFGTLVIQLVWYILKQLFTSVLVKVVNIYLHFGE